MATPSIMNALLFRVRQMHADWLRKALGVDIGISPSFGLAKPRLMLPPPERKTDLALEEVRKQPHPKHWKAGEKYIQQLYGSPGQQHHPIPGNGGRFVDAPVVQPGQALLAIEVKTYKKNRTVKGQSIQGTVPLSTKIKTQVLKDVYLRNNSPGGYDPRWIFMDAPPSKELADFLRKHNISTVTYL